jgi:hypothetical protein
MPSRASRPYRTLLSCAFAAGVLAAGGAATAKGGKQACAETVSEADIPGVSKPLAHAFLAARAHRFCDTKAFPEAPASGDFATRMKRNAWADAGALGDLLRADASTDEEIISDTARWRARRLTQDPLHYSAATLQELSYGIGELGVEPATPVDGKRHETDKALRAFRALPAPAAENLYTRAARDGAVSRGAIEKLTLYFRTSDTGRYILEHAGTKDPDMPEAIGVFCKEGRMLVPFSMTDIGRYVTAHKDEPDPEMGQVLRMVNDYNFAKASFR